MIIELNKILEYIEANLNESISLGVLCEKYHYSETHLSRSFNRYVGKSLKEYINKRRLSVIAIELRNNNKSIQFLAHTYGYSSQKYLSNLFKKEFSVTPTEYRNGSRFIKLTPRRTINGGNKMIINNIKEMCVELSHKIDSQESLLDKIGMIDNCELFSQKGGNVKVITYIESDKNIMISELDLNVLTGVFAQKTIFNINKEKHGIKDVYKAGDHLYIDLFDIKTGQTLTAEFYEGSK